MIYAVFYSTNYNPEGVLYGYVDTVDEARAFIEKWKSEGKADGMYVFEESYPRTVMHNKEDSGKWEILYVEEIPKLEV
jgi:hypothetical protein